MMLKNFLPIFMILLVADYKMANDPPGFCFEFSVP